VALALLARYGLTATLFVPTAYVGSTSRWLAPSAEAGRRIADWGQLVEVADAGIECGSHSHTHPELDRVTDRQAAQEARVSRQLMEDHLQRTVSSFAYPFGYHGRAARRAVAAAGYRQACAVGELPAGPGANLMAIPRLSVEAGTDTSRLAAMLAGAAGRRETALSESKRLIWLAWRRYGERRAPSPGQSPLPACSPQREHSPQREQV
ncbi:MAG: polysaccharide deacetylase family protein, partial [Acidimicrobiales bacterium]